MLSLLAVSLLPWLLIHPEMPQVPCEPKTELRVPETAKPRIVNLPPKPGKQ